MNTKNLKACLFCGSKNVDIETDMVNPDEIYGAQVTCSTCDAKGPFLCWYDDIEDAKNEAVKAWNAHYSGWISVESELPEQTSSYYLCLSTCDDCVTVTKQDVLLWIKRIKCFSVTDGYTVTHWMPLLDAPISKEIV